MVNNRGRGHNLCLRFFKKVRSFTPTDLRSGILSLSSIRLICKCRCPPLRGGGPGEEGEGGGGGGENNHKFFFASFAVI
jgi:hypothetical protein